MEQSLLLAKVIGLTLIFTSSALLINKKNIDLLFSLYGQTTAIFITGFLETVLGILLVLKHNVWTLDFRVIITIIGWILLVRGVGRIFFPDKSMQMVSKFKKNKTIFTPLLLFVFLIGAYLTYKGFTI